MKFWILILTPVFSWAQVPSHISGNSLPLKNYEKICKAKAAIKQSTEDQVRELARCLDEFLNNDKEYVGMAQCSGIVRAMAQGSTRQAYRTKCNDYFAYDDCRASAGEDDKAAADCLRKYSSSASYVICRSEVERLQKFKFPKNFCDKPATPLPPSVQPESDVSGPAKK